MTVLSSEASFDAEAVKLHRDINGCGLLQSKSIMYLEHVDAQIDLLEKNPNRMATRGDLAAAMRMMMKITGKDKR